MDWKEALTSLIALAPKLAYKAELVEALKTHLKASAPPPTLMPQMEVIMLVAKQNQRVAELHGYPLLADIGRKVEVAASNVIQGLKAVGIAATKPAQAAHL